VRWSIVDFWLRDLCRVGWAELVNRMYIHSINLLLWFLNLVIKLECSKSGLVTLTRLGNKDLTKSSDYVFQYVETWKHQWFRRGTYWWEDWSRLIVMRKLCYWSIELRDRQWTEYLMVTVTVLRLYVKKTCYLLSPSADGWDCLLISVQTWYIYTSCYWNYWKNIIRRNTCFVLLFYRLHVILFTLLLLTSLTLLLSPYHLIGHVYCIYNVTFS